MVETYLQKKRKTVSVTRHGITWNPQGKRRKGRPTITWQRSVESEMREMSPSWEQLERLAQDRNAWKALVGGLCTRKRAEGL
jgi:hypothetical protein